MKTKNILLIVLTISLLQLSFITHGKHGCEEASNYAKMIISDVDIILENNDLVNTKIKKYKNIGSKFKSSRYYANKCNCHQAYELAKEGEQYAKSLITIEESYLLQEHLKHIKAISEGIIIYVSSCEND